MNKIHKLFFCLISFYIIFMPILPLYEMPLFFVSIIMLIISFFIFFVDKFKINNVEKILCFFPFVHLLILLFSLNSTSLFTNIKFMIIETAFIYSSIVFKHVSKKENIINLLNLILTSSLIYFIFSISSVFLSDQLSFAKISCYFGDTYLTSIDRFYGLLGYPNANAIFSLINIIISFYFIFNEKDNVIYKILFFINSFMFVSSFSKMPIIVAIFIIVFCIIYYFINKIDIKSIFNIIISSIVPIFFSIILLRKYLINHNLFFFALSFLLFVCMFLAIEKLFSNKNKFFLITYLIVIIFTSIILIIKPYSIPLKINNVSDNNRYFIVDFILEKNTDYNITFNIEGNSGGAEIHLIEYYVDNLIPREKDLGKINNGSVNFKSSSDFEYYMISVENINVNTDIEISELKINESPYVLNSYFVPYQFVHQFNLLKYDKESVTHRFWYYQDAIKYIKNNKFIIGNGHDSFSSYKSNRYLEQTVHSFPLQLWLDYGIYGLIFYLTIVFSGLFYIYKYIKVKEKFLFSVLFLAMIIMSPFDCIYDSHYLRYILYIVLLLLSKKEIDAV